MRNLLTLFVSLLLGISGLLGQETTGSISGLIKDPTGAVIVGANIVATNLATGAEVRTTSDESGNYLFPLLRAGNYRVTVESPRISARSAG